MSSRPSATSDSSPATPASNAGSRHLQFAGACAGMAMFGIVQAMLGALFALPGFRARLQLDVLRQGEVLSLLFAGTVIVTPLVGPIIDRFGNKLVLVTSTTLVSAALLGFTAATSFEEAAISGFIVGFGGGGLNIAANALVSDVYGDDRGPMMNYLGIFYGLGAIIIPLMVATVSSLLSPAQFVLCAFALATGCTFAYVGLRFPPPRESQGFSLSEILQVATWPGVLLFGAALFLESGDESILLNFLPTYAGSLKLAAAEATAALTFFLFAFVAGRMLAGRILRYFTAWQLEFASAGASLIAYAIFISVHSKAMLWASSALMGLCFAALYPTALAIIGDRYPRFSATVFSVIFTVALAGGILFPWLVGKIAAQSNMHSGMMLPLVSRTGFLCLLLVLRSRDGAMAKR